RAGRTAHAARGALLTARCLACRGRYRAGGGERRRRLGEDRRGEGLHGRVGGLADRVLLRPLQRLRRIQRTAAAPRGRHAQLDRQRGLRRASGRGPCDRGSRQRDPPVDLRQRRAGARSARPPLSRRARPTPPPAGHPAVRELGRDRVYAAVSRRTLDGKNPNGWIPEQKIGVDEALRAYTWGNAFATFDERTRGVLAPGYDADVVVLDRNLFTLPADSLDQAGVRCTIV